jgi:hypothetical protein
LKSSKGSREEFKKFKEEPGKSSRSSREEFKGFKKTLSDSLKFLKIKLRTELLNNILRS